MAEIEVKDAAETGAKPPPAVVRSARRKQKRSEPPPSRLQSAHKTPDVELGATMAPLPGYERLPSPPKFSMDPNSFFGYWSNTDREFPNRGTAYVYRTWPRIDRQKIDPEAHKYSDKMDKAFPDPTLWRQEMLHRYGSGNYKLILNDAAGSGKSVGQTMISDLRDSDYPPVIENMDELVMDDPTNQSFIESLRQKGLLPGENALLQAETTEALTGTIDKLTTKLIERKPEPVQPQAQAGAADTAKAAMDMARDVFKQGMDLGKETVTAQAEAIVAKAKAESDAIAAKATAATEAQNPAQSLTMLTQLIDLVQKITPKPAEVPHAPAQDLTTLITTLMTRGDNLQSQMTNLLMEQIKALSAAKASPTPTLGGAQPDDFINSLEKMLGMKKKLQEFLGVTGGGSDADEPEREEKVPAWMQLADKAFEALPTIAMQGVAMTHNLAVARTGQGSPLGPGAMPAVEAAPPGMEGTPPQNPQPQPQGEPMNPIIIGVLRQIEKPFLTFLNNPEKSGADFAEALMGLYGRTGYDSIRERGKETVWGWLQAYPPIGQVIAQIPERASQFVDEFMDADAILAAEEAAEEPDGAAFVQGQDGG